MIAAEPEQGTGELEQAEIVRGLLLPPDQDPAALVEPRDRALDYPAPSRMALRPRGALVADERDVGLVAVVDAGAPAVVVVVALVQAQVLLVAVVRLRPLQDHGPDRLVQQPGIRHVRPGDGRRQRAPVLLHQQALLHAGLRAVGGVGADQVPPLRALPRAQSAACHSQSQPPRSSQASWTAAQMRSKMPRRTQRRKWRCTVLSSGYSAGRWFHWQPLRSRKITASRTGRRSTQAGPNRAGGSCSARIRSTSAHNSS